MSEELEWELFDIFEAALFHFPVYEHKTARKIVRYLLYRGVIEEEIADAIEDSTVDLHLWLNKQGKNMVGEWVIAWINEARREYLAEKAERGEENYEEQYSYRSTVSRERTPWSDDSDEASGGEGSLLLSREHRYSRHRLRRRSHRSTIEPDNGSDSDGFGGDNDIDLDETEVKRRMTPPPPLPPRSLTLRRGVRDIPQLRHIDSSTDSTSDIDIDVNPTTKDDDVIHHVAVTTPQHKATRRPESDFYERTPDSGAVSDIYSSIPTNHRLSSCSSRMMNSDDFKDETENIDDAESLATIIHHSIDTQTTGESFSFETDKITALNNNTSNSIATTMTTTTHCPTHGTEHITAADGISKVCPSCTCKLTLYTTFKLPLMSACTIETNTDGVALTSSQDSLMQLTPPAPPTCALHAQNDPACDIYHATCGQQTTTIHDDDNLHSEEELDDDTYNSTDTTTTKTPQHPQCSPAMLINIDTLDRGDGPGYIFIMTDSLENCLPWSSEHRYKVASSRRPERYVSEFRSRNVDVELIWQIRVASHLKAVGEVHSSLGKYNLHSNWFKCSLSVIMDIVSRTVRKYKCGVATA